MFHITIRSVERCSSRVDLMRMAHGLAALRLATSMIAGNPSPVDGTSRLMRDTFVSITLARALLEDRSKGDSHERVRYAC
jgi:hypothetical protein